MAPETFLLIEVEPRRGTRHTIAPDTTIGRERCDILLEDSEVSRRHAAVRSAGGGVAIEDLASRNGTFVNGERVDGTRALTDGDTVRVGGTSWRFQASTEGETTFGRVRGQEEAAKPEPATSGRVQGEVAGADTPPAGGRSGDVPAPTTVPSAVQRIPARATAPPAFPTATRRRIRRSAARRGGAVLASYAAVIATAAAVIAYFAAT